MPRLVLLNFISAFLFMATMIAFEESESGLLLIACMGLTFLLGILALWNIGAVFALWGRYGFRAVYPVIAFFLAVTLCFQGSRYVIQLRLAGTPCRPDSFIQGQTKIDLEQAATQVLGQSFKNIPANPSPQARMILGYPRKAV